MNIAQLYGLFNGEPKICTDSRKVFENCMYFALKGENFDGNAFAMDALEQGAAYAVVDDATLPDTPGLIRVPNALAVLQQLAAHHRRQFDIPVIGVTGSNGKTTTKELMHSVLSEKFTVLATTGNLNNHIGVPLTLFKLQSKHDIAIIEMGASRQGEIQELCKIAQPTHGLITNIGKAHLETMGGIEGVLKTKTELFAHLAAHGGKPLVHSCDKLLVEAAAGNAALLYGALPTDDVQGRIVRDGNLVSVQWVRKQLGVGFDKVPVVKTQLTGTYNLPNLMAAVATGVLFGLNDEEIARGISEYRPSNNRSEVRQHGSNTFILDAYNANPTSMDVALTNLVSSDAQRHSAILGEMLEVGPTSAEEHHKVCQRIELLKLHTVCLVGKEFEQFKGEFPFHFFMNVDELNTWLKTHPFENETVLIKGSRGNRLEKAAELLLT